MLLNHLDVIPSFQRYTTLLRSLTRGGGNHKLVVTLPTGSDIGTIGKVKQQNKMSLHTGIF